MSGNLLPRGRRPLGAYVTGYSAALIFRMLERPLMQSIRAHHAAGRLELAGDLAVTLADLREADAQYRATTEAGSAEAAPAPEHAPSEVPAPSGGFLMEVDVRVAAERLGVTERRVRQLLGTGELAGQQDRTGRWSVNVDDLHRLAAERSIPA